MASTADQRLLDLLGKWLNSLELHLQYASLDDASYWKLQSWPAHQRPTRWIIELARQKTIALREQVQERLEAGDTGYCESLETMIFLTNLVGFQHIERFIPMAGTDADQPPQAALEMTRPTDDRSPTAKEPVLPAVHAPPDRATETALQATGTREMPQFLEAQSRQPPATGTRSVARTERKGAAVKPAPRSGARAKQAAPAAAPSDAARDLVIADAARLVQWGRNWFELPELIARMADRPPLPEVRRILNDNKKAIDEMSGRR